jgi:hypothetical protein
MRKAIRAVAAVLGLALLEACTAYRPTPAYKIHETNFVPLVPGVHTKEDFRRLVGEPLVEFHFSRLNEDVWEYRYIEGVWTPMLAWISFDPNGVYKSAFYQLDGAYSGSGRGR